MVVFLQAATASPPAPVPNLVGYWMLDEGSGSNAADSSGAGHDGTLNNSPPWVSGRFGQALDFDGGSGAVTIDDSPALNNLDQFSLSMWFFADSVGGPLPAVILAILSGMVAVSSFIWRYFLRYEQEYARRAKDSTEPQEQQHTEPQ